jgi:hypothetical protein
LETLECRTLFSAPPITSAPEAQVAVTDVQALLADPTRDNIVYMLAGNRVTTINTDLAQSTAWSNTQSPGDFIAVSPAGDRLYISEPATSSIEVLSLPDLAHLNSFQLNVDPGSIAAGVNNQLYIATAGGQSQQLIQLNTVTGISAVSSSLWGNNQLRADADGTHIYTMLIDSGGGGGLTVDEYDVTGSVPIKTNSYPVDYSNSQDFQVDASHRVVFTANGGVYGVGVTNMDTDARADWLFDESAYGSSVALSTDGSTVFSAGAGSDSYIQSYNVDTGENEANYLTSPYSVMPRLLTVTANGRILYVGSLDINQDPNEQLTLIGSSTLAINNIPNARATSTITPGNNFATVSFDASTSDPDIGNSITSYAWDFGDGQTGTGVTAQHAYTTPGQYSVTLTVTSTNTLTDSYSFVVSPSLTARLNGPYGLISGQSIPFTAAGSNSDFGPIVTYEWDTNYDGTSFSTDLTGASPTFNAAGIPGNSTRTLALRITDSAGNSTIATTTITIAAVNINAVILGLQSVLSDSSLSLSGQFSTSNFSRITSYEWDTDYDGSTFVPLISGSTPTISTTGWLGGTNRIIALRVTDSGGNVALATTSITVINIPPTATLTTSPAPTFGSSVTRFTVTYRDEHGIDLATLNSSNVVITDSNGLTYPASFISETTSNSPTHDVAAIYQISSPRGGWDGNANGLYTVNLNTNAVTDDSSASVPAGVLGTFSVMLRAPDAPDLRVAFLSAVPAKMNAGTHFQVTLRVSNDGDRDLASSMMALRLYASTNGVLNEGDISIGIVSKRLSLKKGDSEIWTLTATVPSLRASGEYHLLADVDSSSLIKERNEKNNVVKAKAPVDFIARTPDLGVEFGVKRTIVSVGQTIPVYLRLTNDGIVTAAGRLAVRIYVMTTSQPNFAVDPFVLQTSYSINLRPGAQETVPAFFAAPAALAGHSYLFYVLINSASLGDNNHANDASIARNWVTIR